MSNPLFSQLQSGNADTIQQFQQFRQRMQNVNPKDEVMRMLQSGRINQQQLNHAQRMAQQMQSVFGTLKK